jgi:hypothetical protein
MQYFLIFYTIGPDDFSLLIQHKISKLAFISDIFSVSVHVSVPYKAAFLHFNDLILSK